MLEYRFSAEGGDVIAGIVLEDRGRAWRGVGLFGFEVSVSRRCGRFLGSCSNGSCNANGEADSGSLNIRADPVTLLLKPNFNSLVWSYSEQDLLRESGGVKRLKLLARRGIRLTIVKCSHDGSFSKQVVENKSRQMVL